jgi:hypothetical protein
MLKINGSNKSKPNQGNNMKFKHLFSLALAASVLLGEGCSSVGNYITPAVVQEGVAAGVQAGVQYYPQSLPYLEAAAPIICTAANGTNFDPAVIVADLQSAPQLQSLATPEGTLILNGALALYIGIWDSYGESSVTNNAQLQAYLQATCNGFNEGLANTNPIVLLKRGAVKPHPWPLVRPTKGSR